MPLGALGERRPRQAFHFDLKPRNNYGDSVLFELVRQLFGGYAHRHAFLVTDTANLRHPVSPRTLARINADFDLAILGGGGLMLRSTNPNLNSGWQWNISLERLAELSVPLVVFAVGYNRFEGEPDFEPIFTDHLNATVAKSVFFGVRNSGSIRQMRTYLRHDLADRVSFQPCPTTVASYLVPDLHVPDLQPEKRVGLQVTFEPRNELAGYDQRRIFAQLLLVARELRRQGYELDVISHGAVDNAFRDHLAENGVSARPVALHEPGRGVYAGLQYYGRLPLTIGMRGHGQMIPFGMGNGIISIAARDKLRYFTEDIGRPDLAIDPGDGDWFGQVLDLVDSWFGDFDGQRAQFAATREGLWSTTLSNLGRIAELVAGNAGEGFTPSHPYERELALNAFTPAMERDLERERLASATRELRAIRADLSRTQALLRSREAELAEGGLHLIYRNLRRRVAALVRGR